MNRRNFLRGTTLGTFGILSACAFRGVFAEVDQPLETFKGTEVFDRILKNAKDGNWAALPIGQCMGKIAKEFEGTQYVGFTLELSKDKQGSPARSTWSASIA